MVSGNLDLGNSIIMDNKGCETGGSIFIRHPMNDNVAVINVHDNLITNNSSPNGKEIFINWENLKVFFPNFNNNDWGDENPNDPSVIDPKQITYKSKVTSTIKSNLLNILNLGLLTKYSDLIKDYFPDGYLDNIQKELDNKKNINNINQKELSIKKNINQKDNTPNNQNKNIDDIKQNTESSQPSEVKLQQKNNLNTNSSNNINPNSTSQIVNDNPVNNQVSVGNSTTHGDNDKAYELNESKSVVKQSSVDNRYFIVTLVIAFILLAIGFRRKRLE